MVNSGSRDSALASTSDLPRASLSGQSVCTNHYVRHSGLPCVNSEHSGLPCVSTDLLCLSSGLPSVSFLGQGVCTNHYVRHSDLRWSILAPVVQLWPPLLAFRGLVIQAKASALITTLGILISHASILDSRTNDCTNDYVRHAGPERQFSRAGRLH